MLIPGPPSSHLHDLPTKWAANHFQSKWLGLMTCGAPASPQKLGQSELILNDGPSDLMSTLKRLYMFPLQQVDISLAYAAPPCQHGVQRDNHPCYSGFSGYTSPKKPSD